MMLLVETCERLGDYPAVANCLDSLIALKDTDAELRLTAQRTSSNVVLVRSKIRPTYRRLH